MLKGEAFILAIRPSIGRIHPKLLRRTTVRWMGTAQRDNKAERGYGVRERVWNLLERCSDKYRVTCDNGKMWIQSLAYASSRHQRRARILLHSSRRVQGNQRLRICSSLPRPTRYTSQTLCSILSLLGLNRSIFVPLLKIPRALSPITLAVPAAGVPAELFGGE